MDGARGRGGLGGRSRSYCRINPGISWSASSILFCPWISMMHGESWRSWSSWLAAIGHTDRGLGRDRGSVWLWRSWAASFQKLGFRPQHLYLCCGRPASQILLESGAFPLVRRGPDCWFRGCFEKGRDGLFHGALPGLRTQHKPNRIRRFGVSYPPGYDMA